MNESDEEMARSLGDLGMTAMAMAMAMAMATATATARNGMSGLVEGGNVQFS